MARLNNASSRVRWSSCNRIRIAQISFSFSGGFWPSSLPLFHGVTHPVVFVDASMSRSFLGERSLMLISTDGRFTTLTSRSIFSRADVQKIKLPSDSGEFRQSRERAVTLRLLD